MAKNWKQVRICWWDIEGRYGYFYVCGKSTRINAEDLQGYKEEKNLNTRIIRFNIKDIVEKSPTFVDGVLSTERRLTKGTLTEDRDEK